MPRENENVLVPAAFEQQQKQQPLQSRPQPVYELSPIVHFYLLY